MCPPPVPTPPPLNPCAPLPAVFAFTNGEVVPNPVRQGAATCTSPDGQEVLCCTWAPDAFGKAYLSLAGVTILWTMLLANQIRVFVVSGTIAQW